MTYSVAGPGAIAGPAVVVIQGPGTVNLNSRNSYTGGTNLLGGTLNVGDPGALGTGTLTIAGGAIDNTTGSTTTFNGSDVVVAGSFTFIGTNDLSTGFVNVTLAATPTVTVANAASTLTINGPIGDGGNGFGFTKDGPGTLLLGSANTYSGTTTLAAGSLLLSSSGTLGGGSAPLTVTGGTLDLGFSTQPLGPVTITGGTIQNGTLSATVLPSQQSCRFDARFVGDLGRHGGFDEDQRGHANSRRHEHVCRRHDNQPGHREHFQRQQSRCAATLTLNGGTLQVTAATTLSGARGITLGASNGTINVPFTGTGVIDSGTSGTPPATIGYVQCLGVISGPGGLTVTGGTGTNDPTAAPYLLVLGTQLITMQGQRPLTMRLWQMIRVQRR